MSENFSKVRGADVKKAWLGALRAFAAAVELTLALLAGTKVKTNRDE